MLLCWLDTMSQLSTLDEELAILTWAEKESQLGQQFCPQQKLAQAPLCHVETVQCHCSTVLCQEDQTCSVHPISHLLSCLFIALLRATARSSHFSLCSC